MCNAQDIAWLHKHRNVKIGRRSYLGMGPRVIWYVHKMQRVHFICRNCLSAHVLISIAPVGLKYITHKYAVIKWAE